MRTREWRLQDAKTKFNELVKQAVTHGPQYITEHGEPTVVILSAEDYHKLTNPAQSLVEFFQSSPLKGVVLDLKRDQSPARISAKQKKRG